MPLNRSSLRQLFLSVLALAAIIFVVYWPSLFNRFVNWDDDVHLLQNPFVQSFSVKDIFTTTVNTTYIPLTELSFALQYYFWGGQPFIYHWTNVVLHVLVSVMVVFFALRLGAGLIGAFLAGLIFGIHPMHVESVAWVTQRKDVLYSFFYMVSLLTYCGYLQGPRDGSRRYLLYLTFISGFFSLLAKPMALSLPLVLLVLDWYLKRNFSFWSVLEKILLGVLFLPVIWMTYSSHQRAIQYHFPDSLFLAIWNFTIYLRKFFWPEQFYLFYRVPSPLGFSQGDCVIALIIFAALSAVFFSFKWRIFNFAVLFYVASIFFVVRFDQIGDPGNVADRFMYLASAGFCVAIGVLAEHCLNQKKAVFAVTLVVIAGVMTFLALKTDRQVHIWQNGVALWEHQLKAENKMVPALLYNKAGEAYFQRWQGQKDPQDVQKAQERLKKAVAIRPDYANAYRNLGQLCLETGDLTCADRHLAKALSLDPQDFEVSFQLGRLKLAKGRQKEARKLFEQALECSPDNPYLRKRIDTLLK